MEYWLSVIITIIYWYNYSVDNFVGFRWISGNEISTLATLLLVKCLLRETQRFSTAEIIPHMFLCLNKLVRQTYMTKAIVVVPAVIKKSSRNPLGPRLELSLGIFGHFCGVIHVFSSSCSVPFSDIFSRASFTLASNGDPRGNAW